jgi:hypothetical protein
VETSGAEKMVGLNKASMTASVSFRGGGSPRLKLWWWPRAEEGEDEVVVEELLLRLGREELVVLMGASGLSLRGVNGVSFLPISKWSCLRSGLEKIERVV